MDEVAGLVHQATLAVRSGVYGQLFGIRRKLDWTLSVSAFIREEPSGQSLPWTDLLVAGEALGRRASDPQPAIPTQPFGPPVSFDIKQSANSVRVGTPLLKAWLEKSHYWNPEACIQDALERCA